MAPTSCKLCECLSADVLAAVEATKGDTAKVAKKTAHLSPQVISEWNVRVHRRHRKAERRAATGDGREVTEGIDEYVEDATETTEGWYERQGIELPPDFVGGTVEVQVDGKKHWLRTKPQAAGEVLPEVDFDALRQKVASFIPDQRRWAPPTTEEVTYFVAPSDLQGGKPGTDEAIETLLSGVRHHRQEIDHLKDRGYNIRQVVRGNGGDIAEAFSSTFANQHYVAVLNLRQQIDLAVDVQLAALQILRCPGEWSIEDLYVPSNHGEWTRNGGNSPTTDSQDNIDLHVGDMIRRLTIASGMEDVKVLTAEKHFIARAYSGTLVYLSHGYEEKGSGPHEQKVVSAIQRQILGNLEELHKVRIAAVGHYHHDYRLEQSGWTLFGLAAAEAEWSSQYMRKKFGTWSRSGVTGFLVGEGLGPREYSHHQVFS